MIEKRDMINIVFGMGRVGKAFVDNGVYADLIDKEVFFYDNDKSLPEEYKGIQRLNSIWDQKIEKIIVASGAWLDIYEECILHGFSPDIYDMSSDSLLSYKEMCIKNEYTYKNDLFITYENDSIKERDEGVRRFKQTGLIYENINEIAIMLSNLCNYASVHTKCPANQINSKEILPLKTVYRVLDELAEINFDGTICFHIYNEPLIDPRLGVFMRYAKEKMPSCTIRLYSNGYYLDQTMVDDLLTLGMDALCVTGYGKSEYLRLISLELDIPYMVIFGNLDERLDYYKDTDSVILENVPCMTFFTQTTIYSNGDLGLCCLDYKHGYCLGNVKEKSLRECLNSDKTVEVQRRLIDGDRSVYSLCKNCRWSR